jgi:site-specific DNA recombinase
MNDTQLQKPIRVAIYARVSTDFQEREKTIESQIEECKKFALAQGWQLIKVYKDEGISGAIMDRPAFKQLLFDAEKGLFEMVLIYDLDRLARSKKVGVYLEDELEARGIKLYAMLTPLREDEDSYFLEKGIKEVFSDWQRRYIRRITTRGRRNKAAVRKLYVGGTPCYGYRYIPKNRTTGEEGHLEIEPFESSIVKKIFNWIDEELSEGRVIHRLQDEKIFPPYKTLPYRRSNKGKETWGRSTLKRLLSNEFYIGNYFYARTTAVEAKSKENLKDRRIIRHIRPQEEWIRVELPPELRIIEPEQFWRVQQRLQNNKRFTKGERKNRYFLRGLIFCANCNCPYVGEPGHGRYPCYRCSNRARSFPNPPTCRQRSISTKIMDGIIWEEIKRVVLNPQLLLSHIEQLKEKQNARKVKNQTEIEHIEQALKALEIEEDRLLEAYKRGIFPIEKLEKAIQDLKDRKTTLTTNQENLNGLKTIATPVIKKSVHEFCREAAERLESLDFEQKQCFLRSLINRVDFNGEAVTLKGIIPVVSVQNSDHQHQRLAVFSGGFLH